MNDSLLSVRNASGRQVSLLNSNEENNNNEPPNNNSPTSFTSTEEWQQDSQQSKRKYHCIEPGCNKSFTTSGHLARHNRIHTGEKNFPCLFPGCQSRFSRQDNMMQHYRTHMSPKSRRSQKRGLVEDIRPRPRLHAHHRIRSDPVRVEPPLTIDQHLSNYHESLKNVSDNPVERYKPVRFNFPLPLSSIAKTPSNLKKSAPTATTAVLTPPISQPLQTIVEPSPTPTPTTSLSRSSSTTSLPSFQKANDTQYDENNNSSNKLFYQHRPLTFTRFQQNVQQFPYTLLHPDQRQHDEFVNNNSSQKRDDRTPPHNNSHENNDNNKGGGSGNTGDGKSASSGGLLQLAHIVSTFG